jgi:hypothetical protein
MMDVSGPVLLGDSKSRRRDSEILPNQPFIFFYCRHGSSSPKNKKGKNSFPLVIPVLSITFRPLFAGSYTEFLPLPNLPVIAWDSGREWAMKTPEFIGFSPELPNCLPLPMVFSNRRKGASLLLFFSNSYIYRQMGKKLRIPLVFLLKTLSKTAQNYGQS